MSGDGFAKCVLWPDSFLPCLFIILCRDFEVFANSKHSKQHMKQHSNTKRSSTFLFFSKSFLSQTKSVKWRIFRKKVGFSICLGPDGGERAIFKSVIRFGDDIPPMNLYHLCLTREPQSFFFKVALGSRVKGEEPASWWSEWALFLMGGSPDLQADPPPPATYLKWEMSTPFEED